MKHPKKKRPCLKPNVANTQRLSAKERGPILAKGNRDDIRLIGLYHRGSKGFIIAFAYSGLLWADGTKRIVARSTGEKKLPNARIKAARFVRRLKWAFAKNLGSHQVYPASLRGAKEGNP